MYIDLYIYRGASIHVALSLSLSLSLSLPRR
jgi:hypothetical protein